MHSYSKNGADESWCVHRTRQEQVEKQWQLRLSHPSHCRWLAAALSRGLGGQEALLPVGMDGQ